ncbi:MAG TPA: rhomboid family intramembrane serine protease [Candidatus Limnocylindria bacterium]|nr:rhomboid family intramembrane serine protease [Candidatus Limnocylindria bacterium]
MQSGATVFESRSQAQALDWSLVLISQGIESLLAQREDDGAWTLEVAAHDWQRASESIAAYERENATVWRQELKWSGLLFDARAVFWFAALVLLHWFSATSRTNLETLGVMDRSAVMHGEWWRIITATTLHGDVAHLASNVVIGIVFLGLAMGCFGAGVALLLSLLGGALGNVASLLLHNDPFRSLGASGVVMASLGLLAAHSLVLARHERRTMLIGRGVIAGCLLVVLLGFSPKSDAIAHVGGFIAGTVLGWMALRFRSFC